MKNKTVKFMIAIFLGLSLFGCLPNTYYSTTDPYAIGLRWNDRGDYKSAAYYWDPLVEKGDCDAEYQVGTLYFTGRSKPQSNKKAIQLWEKAANANQQRAQWALGDLYYQKRGIVFHDCAKCTIKKDLVMALFWYKLFEKSAKYEGEKKYLAYILPLITAEMTNEQIQKAIQKANAWVPTPKDCKARNLW
jgi:hypothetical protein